MDVDEKTAAGQSEYQGQMYYFCSSGCKQTFDENPEKYVVRGGHDAGHHGSHLQHLSRLAWRRKR
jgi:Cu+-exporting ATPase